MQHRWRCYPMPGSIYTAPDIPVQRGPTLVILRDSREPYRVPAIPTHKHAPSNTHDEKDGDESAMMLKRLLAGIRPNYGKPPLDFERKLAPNRAALRPVQIN